MVFGQYFPNPALFGTDAAAPALVSPLQAALVEALRHGRPGVRHLRPDRPATTAPRRPANLAPFFIGFTVAVLITLFAPITQAGWNPARDLGPRLVAFALGWGAIAIPGPAGGFWVYLVGPLIGGPLGGLALASARAGGRATVARDCRRRAARRAR